MVEKDLDDMHPCTIMPLNTKDKSFFKLFKNDIYKLMNTCKRHICNPTCYKMDGDASKHLCRYGFLQPLVNETHFNIETKLLHIERINK